MRGYTVEMAFLMPIILLLIMNSILAMFYYHDKNIISGAAYETAAAGSNKARKKGGVQAQELEAMFRERVGEKCIFFADIEAAVHVGEEQIEVQVRAAGKGMSLSVVKRAAVTRPEEKIRDIQRVKEMGNGAKNHN